MANAKTSMDYVNAINTRQAAKGKSSKQARVAAFNQIKNSGLPKSAAIDKIGQGFVGPVMMRLKYEGIVRNILTEQVVAPGDVPVYDVADEMGKAYFLDSYQGEAVISQYEGKRVMYSFRHLAEFATVQEQDLLELTIDMADYAVNEARQRLQEKEDGYLFDLLDIAITGINATTPDFAGLTSHTVSTTGSFTLKNFTDAAGIAAKNRLDSHNIILNAADYFDLMNWDLTATAVNYKDKTFDGVPITSFAGFNVFRSVIVPTSTAYVLPDADYLGRFPVRKSVEVRNDDKVERFSVGFVIDEYVNEIIVNPNGATKIVKS